jgi:hypothetical protein
MSSVEDDRKILTNNRMSRGAGLRNSYIETHYRGYSHYLKRLPLTIVRYISVQALSRGVNTGRSTKNPYSPNGHPNEKVFVEYVQPPVLAPDDAKEQKDNYCRECEH